MAFSKGMIYKYDLQGNFICEYPSLRAAADIQQISSSNLKGHIDGKWSHCHNHIYTRKYYIKIPKEILDNIKPRVYKTKEIHQYSLDGKYIKSYKSKTEAALENGLNEKTIIDIASGNSGRMKTYGGFQWSYEKKNKLSKFVKKLNYKKVHQYSKDGTYINTFNSIGEASRKLNIKHQGISNCLNHKNTPSYGGFIFNLIKLKKVKPVKPRKTPINVYKNNKFYKTFESQIEVVRAMKLPRSTVYNYLCGYRKKPYKDYTFEYKE